MRTFYNEMHIANHDVVIHGIATGIYAETFATNPTSTEINIHDVLTEFVLMKKKLFVAR